MATHHARPRSTAPRWARGLTTFRRIEATAERYWALAAYAMGASATAAYVVAQLAYLR